jgi:hypothetical protein
MALLIWRKIVYYHIIVILLVQVTQPYLMPHLLAKQLTML